MPRGTPACSGRRASVNLPSWERSIRPATRCSTGTARTIRPSESGRLGRRRTGRAIPRSALLCRTRSPTWPGCGCTSTTRRPRRGATGTTTTSTRGFRRRASRGSCRCSGATRSSSRCRRSHCHRGSPSVRCGRSVGCSPTGTTMRATCSLARSSTRSGTVSWRRCTSCRTRRTTARGRAAGVPHPGAVRRLLQPGLEGRGRRHHRRERRDRRAAHRPVRAAGLRRRGEAGVGRRA